MCGGPKAPAPQEIKKDPDTKLPDDGDSDAAREADLARRRRAGYAQTSRTGAQGVVVGANDVAKKQLFGA